MTKHNDRHLTTEELSALLDGQLSEQEQAHCDAHLKTCQQCRLALADLRQTVSLLHALPEPELPRSFVLPTSVTYMQERAASSAATPQANPSSIAPEEQERQQRQRGRRRTLRRSARIISLIAAVIGLFILAPGVFAILPRFSNNVSTNTASSGRSAASSASTHQTSAQPSNSSSKENKTSAPNISGAGTLGTHPTPTPTATLTPTATATATKYNNIQSGPTLPFPDLRTPLGQQEVGFPLVVLGIIGLLLTRRKRGNEKSPSL